MTKDDVDSFVVDMKTLASILGHNDDVLMEKFKDVFPDPNIEAALIAMDDFALMQKKAKQLVHIYKPAHDSPLASAAILVHTEDNTATKVSHHNLKVTSINWPLLIIHKKTQIQGMVIIVGDNVDMTEVPVAMEVEVTPITGMITRSAAMAVVKGKETFNIIKGVDKITHIEVDEDSGMEMTQITVTEITGIETLMVKVILTGVENGTIITEVKDTVIVEEGEDGIPTSNITIQGINRNPSFLIQIITVLHQWDINTGTQSRMINTHIPRNHNNINHKGQLHLNKLQIFVNCGIVKATMTINVNLQAILWPAHKKPSIKADHTATRTLIMATGHKVEMITMTLTGNLFSSRGSRCR